MAPPLRKALLSVSNKTGIVDFARRLHDCGVELVSTGGTARKLKEAGLPVTKVSEMTGAPEIFFSSSTCMASTRAACTFAGARLISSASTRLAKIGPFLAVNSPVCWW